MATGPAHMAPGRLEWQQGLTTWHKGGWDGNRVWPHGTRVAGMATGSCHTPPGRLRRQQGLAKWHQGGWNCDRVWPHGTRVAGMETGQCHMEAVTGNRPACMAKVPDMIQGWLGCQKATGRLGWHQGLTTLHQGCGDGNRAWPHGIREAWMATGSGPMAPGWLGWQQDLAK